MNDLHSCDECGALLPKPGLCNDCTLDLQFAGDVVTVIPFTIRNPDGSIPTNAEIAKALGIPTLRASGIVATHCRWPECENMPIHGSVCGPTVTTMCVRTSGPRRVGGAS